MNARRVVRLLIAFLLLAVAAPASAQSTGYIDVIVIPPVIHFDWSSPTGLLFSIMKSGAIMSKGTKYGKSGIGHALLRLNCSDSQGDIVDEWAGFSGDNHGVGRALVLKKGDALGVIFHLFDDGHVQTTQDVLSRLELIRKYDRTNPMAIRVPIDASQCDVARDHLVKFRSIEKPVYGFPVDPLTYQGAGCTSFAVSFLQKTGTFDPIFESWKRTLTISHSHIGNKFGNKGISILKYLKEKFPWIYKDKPNETLTFLDPGLMHGFFAKAHACLEGDPSCLEDDEMLPWLRANHAEVFQTKYYSGVALNAMALPDQVGNTEIIPPTAAPATPQTSSDIERNVRNQMRGDLLNYNAAER